MTTYTECLEGLYSYLLRKKPNNDFWTLIDMLDVHKIFEYNEKLLSYKLLEGSDYLLIVSINNQYKSSKSLSVKQKRASVMLQLALYEELFAYN